MTARPASRSTTSIRHPLTRWPGRNRRQIFIGLLVLWVAFSVVLAVAGRDLRTDDAPLGVVSLQLADADTSRAIIDQWEAEGVTDEARFSLWFDFLYLLAYGPLLAGAVATVAGRLERRGWPGLVMLGTFVAWGALLAAGLDAAEDLALLQLLAEPASSGLATAATVLASLKFALLGAGIVYLLAGFLPARAAGDPIP